MSCQRRAFNLRLKLHRLRVQLERASPLPEGSDVHTVAGLAAGSESGRAFVDVMVPGDLLPPGTYIVFLTRVSSTGSQELRPYSFSVGPR